MTRALDYNPGPDLEAYLQVPPVSHEALELWQQLPECPEKGAMRGPARWNVVTPLARQGQALRWIMHDMLESDSIDPVELSRWARVGWQLVHTVKPLGLRILMGADSGRSLAFSSVDVVREISRAQWHLMAHGHGDPLTADHDHRLVTAHADALSRFVERVITSGLVSQEMRTSGLTDNHDTPALPDEVTARLLNLVDWNADWHMRQATERMPGATPSAPELPRPALEALLLLRVVSDQAWLQHILTAPALSALSQSFGASVRYLDAETRPFLKPIPPGGQLSPHVATKLRQMTTLHRLVQTLLGQIHDRSLRDQVSQLALFPELTQLIRDAQTIRHPHDSEL